MIKFELCAVEVTDLLISIEHRSSAISDRIMLGEEYVTEGLLLEREELGALHRKLTAAAEREGFKL